MNAELFMRGTDDVLPDELEAAMRCHVRMVYNKFGGNITRAASALKVSRNTVRKFLNGIDLNT